MNHIPAGAGYYGGLPPNPVPGEYHPRVHGPPLVRALYAWCAALTSGDMSAAASVGTDLLVVARTEGMSSEVEQMLRKHMQAAVHAVRPQVQADPGEKPPNIDLKEPDPSRFYALDKRSGVELADVLARLRSVEVFQARGIRPPTKMLFVGAPGNGKTTGGLWLAGQLDMPIALVRIDATMGSQAGETAKAVRAAFEFARDNKAILLIDEFESVAVPRDNNSPNVPQWNRETTNAVCQLIDSMPEDQFLIGATNHLDLVDSAVQRRMRRVIFFGPPDRDTRAAMVKEWWSQCPHAGSAKRTLLDVTEGRSGDEVQRIAEEANCGAIKRALDRRDETIDDATIRAQAIREEVTVADVVIATARVLCATEDDVRVALAGVQCMSESAQAAE